MANNKVKLKAKETREGAVVEVNNVRYSDKHDKKIIDEFITYLESHSPKPIEETNILNKKRYSADLRVRISSKSRDDAERIKNFIITDALKYVGCLHISKYSEVTTIEYVKINNKGKAKVNVLEWVLGPEYELEESEMVSYCEACESIRKPA